jgi:hypothetical protein
MNEREISTKQLSNSRPNENLFSNNKKSRVNILANPDVKLSVWFFIVLMCLASVLVQQEQRPEIILLLVGSPMMMIMMMLLTMIARM